MTEERKLALREELQGIEDRKGRLTPELVIEYAKKHPRSVLYQEFEWDKDKAAHAYWIQQARAILRSVTIIIQTEDRGAVTVSCYVRDPEVPHDQQGYRSILRIKEEPEPSRLLLLQEFTAAEAHLKRAQDIASVVGHEEETKKALSAIGRQRKRIEASAIQHER